MSNSEFQCQNMYQCHSHFIAISQSALLLKRRCSRTKWVPVTWQPVAIIESRSGDPLSKKNNLCSVVWKEAKSRLTFPSQPRKTRKEGSQQVTLIKPQGKARNSWLTSNYWEGVTGHWFITGQKLWISQQLLDSMPELNE